MSTEKKPVYRWQVEVRRWNTYGDRVESKTPTSVLATDKAEMAAKVRASFGATWDDFRNFWSHDAVVIRVDEEDA